MYEYVGNIHIHSTYSDGSGSINDIARAAEKARLDFIIITDHFTMLGRAKEGYHGGVLVMVGMEVNRERNHYLALNIVEPVANDDGNPQAVIDRVQQQKGLGFIAHPVEKGSPVYENGATYPWTDWNVRGFTGIEIWNRLSQWRDGITNLWNAIYHTFINPHSALIGPYPQALARWDELLNEGLVVGIGGSDAHAAKVGLGPFKIALDDYRLAFRCINTHILGREPLIGDSRHDAAVVYDCLAAGRCFVAYDYFLSARGFRFWAQTNGGGMPMGTRVPVSSHPELVIEAPHPCCVRLIKDGKLYWHGFGHCHSFNDVTPGVYRVEAFHRHRKRLHPWIFSNPIIVTK